MTQRQPATQRNNRYRIALGAGAAAAGLLLGTAAWTQWQTRRAERRFPPEGQFVDTAAGRVHYIEAGQGSPVILIHGNIGQANDFEASGLFTLLSQRHRVIAIDRPGYGYTERPMGRVWTPAAQAELIHQAMTALNVEKAVVLGHSYGAMIAAAMALAYPDAVKALVLVAGYFYPTPRLDTVMGAISKVPVLGDTLRHSLMPPLSRLSNRLHAKRAFAPRAVSPKYEAFVPRAMMTRPVTLSGMAGDSSLMAASAASISRKYEKLRLPVTIVTGDGDKMVNTERQSFRLHQQLPQSELKVIPHAGHMVHYAAARKLSTWIEALSD